MTNFLLRNHNYSGHNKLLLKQASGFSRLMQIMTAQVPTVYTFGIISVDNPQGQIASSEANNAARKKFQALLRQDQYGWVQATGHYGGSERSYFVMNARKDDVVRWGLRFDQEAVIFGQVNHTEKKVVFEYIEGRATVATCSVVHNPKDALDYKTTYKGRDFYIPFFDDEAQVTDANVPKECPMQEEDVIGIEANVTHLATLHAHKEYIQSDANGHRVGFGVLGHRYKVLKALNALKKK